MTDERWSFCGIPAVLLEGRYLRVTVLPELGGKIYSIMSKADGTELLSGAQVAGSLELPPGGVAVVREQSRSS